MKSKKNLIILAIVIAISLLGVTYAFFDYYRLGANQKITAGKVNLILNDGTTNINLTNVFPETVEKARKEGRTDNIVTFTVSGTNTTTDQDIYYEIMLNEGDPETGMTRFNPEDLVFDLIEVNGDTETYLVDAMSFSDINARRIWVDTITKGTSTTKTRTYKLRMWLNEDVKVSDTNANADYPATGYENYYASVKVSVYGDFVEKGLHLNQVAQSTLSLTEPDVDGTRFVYGNVDNNYVWYSGKLWRIVSIDKDGNIKLITQGNMATMSWAPSYSEASSVFSESLIYKWIKEIFISTLQNVDNLLVDSSWDYTIYSSFPTKKPDITNIIFNEKIGLLNLYEFMMAGGDVDKSDCYLNNEFHWWLITPVDSGRNWEVHELGGVNQYWTDINLLGVRPCVILKSSIKTLKGSGEKNDPYTIDGDIPNGKDVELLTNRISGEYINFNNVKYRIMGKEEIDGQILTKIIMSDSRVNNNSLAKIPFGSGDFNLESGIGKYLNDWYISNENNDEYANTYINPIYKNMIATKDEGIVWYQGTGLNNTGNYLLASAGTGVSATIGLGRIGEMFVSQYGDGRSYTEAFWTLTKNQSTPGTQIYIRKNGDKLITETTSGVRPSFYLKSNVVIGDVDGDGKVGTGMPHDPYEIVQLSE